MAATTRVYDADGLLVRREVDNRPLVFQEKPKELLSVEQKCIPQMYLAEYDQFRRLHKEIFPDGQIRQYEYGPDSRVVSQVRTCTEEIANRQGQNIPKEQFFLQWDRLGRLVKVSTGTLLQEFEYDWQGNVYAAIDNTHQEYPISVKRSYDSLGNLLHEQMDIRGIGLGPMSVIYRYDLPKGFHEVSWDGIHPPPKAWRHLAFAVR